MIDLAPREPLSTMTHGAWFLLSIPATAWLWRSARGGLSKRLSLLIFGLSLSACYLASALFHGWRGSAAQLDVLDRADHVGIHLLIAGSYTPIAWNLISWPWRWRVLAAVWGVSLLATILLLANIRLPGYVSTCEYLVLGWGSLFCCVEIARKISYSSLTYLVAGGLCYSVGAVLNLAGWPTPWPGVFGHHEVFHLWVMGGSSCHYWFMLTVVAPEQNRPLQARARVRATSQARAGLPHSVSAPSGRGR